MDKYEYLTGEDLGYKPGVVEQVKFEYSPLGKNFNKGLKGNEKEEGLLKRFKNIEDENKEGLKMFENKDKNQLSIKSVLNIFGEKLSQEVKNVLNILSNQETSKIRF